MEVFYHRKALKELSYFDASVRTKFHKIFAIIEECGKRLPTKQFKKIVNTDLFEARVKHRNETYRGIGGFVKPNFIVVLFFQKKTQKTPVKELKKAIKRYKNLL